MKCVGGVWLPDYESHLVEWMHKRNEVVDGRLTYQYHKLVTALKYVRQFRVAADVGAHCGLWSMHLVKRFDHVHAFEPLPLHRDCFVKNVAHDGHCTLHGYALGATTGAVCIETMHGSSGNSQVSTTGAGIEVPLKRLDDVLLPVLSDAAPLDFIKLDCEGYELFVLQGGQDTLERFKPVVCVEQKHQFGARYGVDPRAAVAYLQSLGAKLRKEISGDFIMSWDS